MQLNDRAAVFLRAAELLVSPRYRYKVMAATMWGQGKTAWQAEIDAIAELADFWRFNASYAEEIYQQQPIRQVPGSWNRLEYRPLEGFILAISPFNFTAIGGNLPSAPAIMGNVAIWKPSHSAIYSNYLVHEILMEAGLPAGVIQFVPGRASEMCKMLIEHPDFAGLHFTGSSDVFKELWKQIGNNLDKYKNFPRIVGETGGKNMHFVHASANVEHVIHNTIRSAFENQGQKCSACSRAYFPDNLWPEIKKGLIEGTKQAKVGPVHDMTNFVSAVIHKNAFAKCAEYINWAKEAKEASILIGGTVDDSVGYYVHPTIIEVTDPKARSMTEEIFGPILTVFVYPANEYEKYLKIADETSPYGLTAALFAQDQEAISKGSYLLRNAAGNFYVNDKCTGAVVGQQPFGGGRLSGTNDKAGSMLNLLRWVSPRTIKETYSTLTSYTYPSNLPA